MGIKLVHRWWGTYWQVDGDPQLYEEREQAEVGRDERAPRIVKLTHLPLRPVVRND